MSKKVENVKKQFKGRSNDEIAVILILMVIEDMRKMKEPLTYFFISVTVRDLLNEFIKKGVFTLFQAAPILNAISDNMAKIMGEWENSNDIKVNKNALTD
ncbi:hypothetical protein [Metaclostridioides mangenotii]|uniref:hypothetical protein n=1 Tax=Metaclostridioides mangenotii TaxID=1540 RepID=UPI000487E413|nr:hypothetical protein [Clostridioides mangenotii]